MEWIRDNKRWITPGGDPVWICPLCGKGRHVYGTENINEPLTKCPDCGAELDGYQWVEEKCKNCKYFRKLEHNFEVDKGYEKSSCCILFTKDPKDGDDYDSFVVEVTPDSICEMFVRR